MKLSGNNCTIADFMDLLSLCRSKEEKINYSVVNGNKFYHPEDKYFCDFNNFPIISKDPDAGCSPIICLASGNNYFLLKTWGKDFTLNQHSSVTAVLLNLGEHFSDVRILDAKFNDESSVYLIKFNGNSGN
jgi:hypothetical protein